MLFWHLSTSRRQLLLDGCSHEHPSPNKIMQEMSYDRQRERPCRARKELWPAAGERESERERERERERACKSLSQNLIWASVKSCFGVCASPWTTAEGTDRCNERDQAGRKQASKHEVETKVLAIAVVAAKTNVGAAKTHWGWVKMNENEWKLVKMCEN